MDTVSGKLPTPEVYVLEIASERIPALGGHLDKIRAVSLPPPQLISEITRLPATFQIIKMTTTYF